ncbi:MAG: molybdopterin-dependent oxidoreductase [Paracoccaceae bacterium]
MSFKFRNQTPPVDPQDLVKDAAKLLPDRSRRRFLGQITSLGALAALTGCDIVNGTSAEDALRLISDWNDWVQARLFYPGKLALTYPDSAITDPFPFNAFYPPDQAPKVNGERWQLYVEGAVQDRRHWTLADLIRLPQETQVTQHICIEGWSAIGKWTGVPMHIFLQRIGADTRRKYVNFICADRYETSLDMATALHPQTQMTLRFGGEALPRPYGFPMKVRVPTKLGFKNPKHVVQISITDDFVEGFWERRGYNWFAGL